MRIRLLSFVALVVLAAGCGGSGGGGSASGDESAAGVAPATSLAHKGAVAGAKVLAASALDLFANTALVDEAKASFKKEIGDVQYKSFLPPDQKPPIHLNKEIMERYRPLLQKFYVKEKPEFK